MDKEVSYDWQCLRLELYKPDLNFPLCFTAIKKRRKEAFFTALGKPSTSSSGTSAKVCSFIMSYFVDLYVLISSFSTSMDIMIRVVINHMNIRSIH